MDTIDVEIAGELERGVRSWPRAPWSGYHRRRSTKPRSSTAFGARRTWSAGGSQTLISDGLDLGEHATAAVIKVQGLSSVLVRGEPTPGVTVEASEPDRDSSSSSDVVISATDRMGPIREGSTSASVITALFKRSSSRPSCTSAPMLSKMVMIVGAARRIRRNVDVSPFIARHCVSVNCRACSSALIEPPLDTPP